MNQVKETPSSEEKATVEGRSTLYNPLLQKPVSLQPVGPGSYPAGFGGYTYMGPPPDFGGSYGAYEDDAGRKQIGVRSSRMFSIFDGSPIQLKAELSSEERDALLAQLDEVSAEYKCEHCRSELMISVLTPMETVFCPHCSSKMDGAAEKVKQCLSKIEENKMDKVQAMKESKLVADEKPLNVNDKDLAKLAEKVEPPKDVHEDPKTKKAELLDHKAAQKDATEVKPMEELNKSNAVKAATERKAKLQKAMAAYRAKKLAKAKSSARKARPATASLDAETLGKLKRELRVMATLEPATFAEVRKNPKLSEICAEVEKTLHDFETRAKVRAELKALAHEDKDKFEEVHKELEFVAPEILMEDKLMKEHEIEHEPEHKAIKADGDAEADAEVKPEGEADEAHKMDPKLKAEAKVKVKADGEADAGMKDDVKPDAAEKKEMEHELKEAKAAPDAGEKKAMHEELKEAKADAEAEGEACGPAMSMKTEFLASLATLKGEKIEMSLYGEESENPFWNLIVDGEPVARIHLADQADASSIRSGFMAESYAENFGNAIGKVGLEKMLTLANARVFAHNVDDSEITVRIREKAKAEAHAEMEEKISTLRNDFLKATSLAMIAANKNFYQEEGRNALKGGLFNALVQAGLTEQHAVWAIEAGFEEAPIYFDFVMDKAVEIMDMPKEARESLEKTIMASGKIEVASGEPTEEDNLMDRLVKSSVSAIAMGGVLSGENREVIRKGMGLNPNRR